MTRDELGELSLITPIANVPSMLKLGILSNERATSLKAISVAMPEIQERRDLVKVPGGRRLHEYANLYLCPRNPMMFKIKDKHKELRVLRVSCDVLDLPGTMIATQNASSDYVAFRGSPAGLDTLDHAYHFAENWTHPGDPINYYRHKSAMCAEVLVPDCVPPEYITGAYTSCVEARTKLLDVVPELTVGLNVYMFFMGPRPS